MIHGPRRCRGMVGRQSAIRRRRSNRVEVRPRRASRLGHQQPSPIPRQSPLPMRRRVQRQRRQGRLRMRRRVLRVRLSRHRLPKELRRVRRRLQSRPQQQRVRRRHQARVPQRTARVVRLLYRRQCRRRREQEEGRRPRSKTLRHNNRHLVGGVGRWQVEAIPRRHLLAVVRARLRLSRRHLHRAVERPLRRVKAAPRARAGRSRRRRRKR